MKVRLVNRAVEIDGEGHGITIAELRRVSAIFHEMFGAEPLLRMTGQFEGDAVGSAPQGSELDRLAWDLRQDSAGGYVPVLHVGAEYVNVQFPTGVNRGRSVAVAPDRGRMVKIRLFLRDD